MKNIVFPNAHSRPLQFCAALFGLWLFSPPQMAAAEERIVSMVLLLSAPRQLDEHTLGTIVATATGTDHSHDTKTESFVVAKPPYYRVRLKSGSYVINNIAAPYFTQTGDFAANIKDAAERRAVLDHRAWLAIDWLPDGATTTDLKPVYQDIGKMAAALAGPDTLALYCPDMDQLALYTLAAARTLRSADPLGAFAGMSSEPPAVSVSGDDPRMKAASAEARKKWPEFVRAFQEKRGSAFAVKGRLVEGRKAEFLWLAVVSLDAAEVHGTLDNDPAVLRGYRLGQDLHIKIADIDDWLYQDRNGQQVGGFTVKVLEAMAPATETKSR